MEQLLAEKEGRTARQLAGELRRRGFEVDKAAVNAVLYRGVGRRFWSDGGTPPRWYTSTAAVPEVSSDPPRLGALVAYNWKSFGGNTTLFITPLTLLYGANSAGKTSLIQSLLVLKQSADTPDLVLDGPHFSGGGFANVVHGHELGRPVHLGAVIDTGDGIGHSLSRAVGYDASSGEQRLSAMTLFVGGQACVFVKDHAADDGSPYWYQRSAADERDVLDLLGVGARREGRSRTSFYVDDNGWPGDLFAVNLDDEAGTVSAKAKAAWQLFNRRERNLQGSLLRRIHHLGPMRDVPDEWVPVQAPEPTGADKGSVVRRLAGEPELLEDVNEWLIRLEVPYDVSVERAVDEETGEPLVGLRVQRRGVSSGEVVRLQDVGFGVGQLLPIVVVVLGTKDGVILIEQPEVHLHPRLQSRVADLLVTSARDYGNRLVVETHSEHLLLRLQRRIAEGQLDHELLHVAYVDRVGDTATIEKLEVDDEGQLKSGWPEGFFDSRFDDLLAIADPEDSA